MRSVKVRLEDSYGRSQLAAEMRGGEFRNQLAINQVYDKLADLRLQFACDDYTWTDAFGAAPHNSPGPGEKSAMAPVSLPGGYVVGVDLKAQLPLITARAAPPGAPISAAIDTACPASAALSAKARRTDDEFEKKALLQQVDAARVNCLKTGDAPSAARGQTLLFSFRVDHVGEYDFKEKGFPLGLVDGRTAGTAQGPVLIGGTEGSSVVFVGLPPLASAGSSDCPNAGCILFPVPESEGPGMKLRLRTSSLQVAGVVAGFGDVPSSVKLWTKGPALVVRATGIRLVAKPSPLSTWRTSVPTGQEKGAVRWEIQAGSHDDGRIEAVVKLHDLSSALLSISTAIARHAGDEGGSDEEFEANAVALSRRACSSAKLISESAPKATGAIKETLTQAAGMAGAVCTTAGSLRAYQAGGDDAPDGDQLAAIGRRLGGMGVKVQRMEEVLGGTTSASP